MKLTKRYLKKSRIKKSRKYLKKHSKKHSKNSKKHLKKHSKKHLKRSKKHLKRSKKHLKRSRKHLKKSRKGGTNWSVGFKRDEKCTIPLDDTYPPTQEDKCHQLDATEAGVAVDCRRYFYKGTMNPNNTYACRNPNRSPFQRQAKSTDKCRKNVYNKIDIPCNDTINGRRARDNLIKDLKVRDNTPIQEESVNKQLTDTQIAKMRENAAKEKAYDKRQQTLKNDFNRRNAERIAKDDEYYKSAQLIKQRRAAEESQKAQTPQTPQQQQREELIQSFKVRVQTANLQTNMYEGDRDERLDPIVTQAANHGIHPDEIGIFNWRM